MKQITVIFHNRPGVLSEITDALAQAGVNIESIDGEAAEESGVISLAVDNYDEALVALRDCGLQAITEDALLIRLRDESGALARVAGRFKEAEIDIRSLRIVKRASGYTLVTLVSDDNEAARKLVADLLVAAL